MKLKESPKVYWDIYWIINNPSTEAMEEELGKFLIVQKRQLQKDVWFNWGTEIRQFKIDFLKKQLWKQSMN